MFKSRTGQIEDSTANGLPPPRHFFERNCVARAQLMARRKASPPHCTLWRNTARVIKDLIDFDLSAVWHSINLDQNIVCDVLQKSHVIPF